jgi:ABC-type amino acid transport substrate-binding protein
VPIYEVGQQKGYHYFSMRLVEGGNLCRRLDQCQNDSRYAAELMAKVARAVEFAHQNGILHRDLKPANILLDLQGQPQVTDFGLAKRVSHADSAHLTRTGAILGTPSYMSPEQAAGRKGITAATDIYSLGAVLYELLTGRPPFHAEAPLDTLMQVVEKEPPTPRLVNSAIPRDLETICLKALAKEPDRRYPSAGAMADDLERFLAGKTIVARRSTRLERFWRWCVRNPAQAAVATMAVILIGVLIAVFTRKTAGTGPRPDGSLDRVRRAGRIVLATDPSYPPMEFMEDGKLVGFDIDLANQLAERIGVRAEFVRADWVWNNLAARLDDHEYDALISSITATDERQKSADFVEYLRLTLVFVCRKGVTVKTPKDLAGKTIVVQAGTTAHRFLEQLKNSGVAVKDCIVVPSAADPFVVLDDGKADVTLAHEPVGRYYARQNSLLAVTGSVGHSMDPDPVGLAFAKSDKELQAEITKALRALRQDGTFKKLLEKWFGE